jgi:hypothetical protein
MARCSCCAAAWRSQPCAPGKVADGRSSSICQRLSVLHIEFTALICWQGPLTGRDKALIISLKAGPLSAEPAVLAELDAMQEMDAKAEIEALYEKVGIDNFTASLAQTLIQQYGT